MGDTSYIPPLTSCTDIVKLDVTTPATAPSGEKACEIGSTQYDTLDAALAAVTAGQTKTIKLLKNIDYNGGITIDNKNITFDLNGFNLNVNNPSGIGLDVKNGSDVLHVGNGEFNITGETGVMAVNNGTVVSVTTAVSTDSSAGVGVYALRYQRRQRYRGRRCKRIPIRRHD